MTKKLPALALALFPDELASAPPAGYRAVYAGDEFCQAKLPTARELSALRARFKGRIVLATPVMTDNYIPRFKDLAQLLGTWGGNAGLAVNDAGALNYLRSLKNFAPAVSVGRVLGFAFRAYLYSSSFGRLFGRLVSAAEVDDRDGIRTASRARLRLHLHTPYKFEAFSRRCYLTRKFNDACRRPCLRAAAVPVSPGPLKEKIILAGNTILCGNDADYARCAGPEDAGLFAGADLVVVDRLSRGERVSGEKLLRLAASARSRKGRC